MRGIVKRGNLHPKKSNGPRSREMAQTGAVVAKENVINSDCSEQIRTLILLYEGNKLCSACRLFYDFIMEMVNGSS